MDDESRRMRVLVLAAGLSRRFGDSDKLMATLNGKPLIAHLLDNLLASGVPADEITVCVNTEATALRQWLTTRNLAVTVCPHASLGMGSTLADAIAAHPSSSGWLICLADMPHIQPTTFAHLREQAPLHALLAPTWRGRRGHPVYFARCWYDELRQLTGDTGAKPLLERNLGQLALLSVEDPGITLDIDTPSDLNRPLDR